MQFTIGKYSILFENGGVEVKKEGKLLYFNHRPVYVSVKTYGGIMEFRDIAYDAVCEQDGKILAQAKFVTDFGSELKVKDVYSVEGNALKIARKYNHRLNIVTLEGEYMAPGGAITGVKVTDHADTPGVGTKDQDPEYLAQYIEKTSLGAEDVKKESGFNFITGASVSGTAIHKGVYAALAQYAQIGGAN